MTNNYNTNSNGPDIEFYIGYDIGLSEIYFNEQIEKIDGSDLFFFYDYENFSIDKILIEFKKESIESVTGSTKLQHKKNMQNAVLWAHSNMPDIYSNRFDNLKHWFEVSYNYYEPEDFLIEALQEEYGEKTAKFYEEVIDCELLNVNFKIASIHGYCQGDYAQVLYIVDNDFSISKDEDEMRSYLTQIFYDTPINGQFTINGQEFYFTHYIDQYSYWDKDDFIEKFKKSEDSKELSNEALDEFFSMLPKDIKYFD